MSSKGRILVIDNSPLYLEVARGSLQDAGFEVVTLDGAEDMADYLADFDPDLVLMDIDMPGISGDEATRIIKNFLGDYRVVLVSEQREEKLAKVAAKCGADGFLRKPSDLEAFVTEVERWMASDD